MHSSGKLNCTMGNLQSAWTRWAEGLAYATVYLRVKLLVTDLPTTTVCVLTSRASCTLSPRFLQTTFNNSYTIIFTSILSTKDDILNFPFREYVSAWPFSHERWWRVRSDLIPTAI